MFSNHFCKCNYVFVSQILSAEKDYSNAYTNEEKLGKKPSGTDSKVTLGI